MFQSLHRGYWWLRKRFNRVARIDGVDVIFINAADQRTPEAERES